MGRIDAVAERAEVGIRGRRAQTPHNRLCEIGRAVAMTERSNARRVLVHRPRHYVATTNGTVPAAS
jgi:hypothetical protein